MQCSVITAPWHATTNPESGNIRTKGVGGFDRVPYCRRSAIGSLLSGCQVGARSGSVLGDRCLNLGDGGGGSPELVLGGGMVAVGSSPVVVPVVVED